ncbi:MAG: MFS transporter, partial [Verrucomicrobia bacterium]|nr:MFS transporter [Verrucomicrobiota bacterium]
MDSWGRMRAIKAQYFFSYAVMGSLVPLLSVYLMSDKGFSAFHVGLSGALMSVAMVISPALITLLADKRIDTRRILAVAFSFTALILAAIYFSSSVTVTLILFLFYGMGFVAMLPLQDGFYFSYAEQCRLRAEPVSSYPMVRVWGTTGFIVPSLLLYGLIEFFECPSSVIVPCAVAFCLLSMINSFRLPTVKATELESQDEGSRESGQSGLPTIAALKVLISPEARFLSLGLVLAFAATTAYYGYISVYYAEVIGIKASQIGLYLSIGVVLEIFFTLMMPTLQRWIHLKGILIAGLFFMALRMLLLATFPDIRVVLITQIGHGLEALALYVVPVMFFNRLAGNEFRNSIQGVYTMMVGGTSRVVGGLMAGVVAGSGLTTLFYFSGGLATASLLVIVFFFRGIARTEEEEGHFERRH